MRYPKLLVLGISLFLSGTMFGCTSEEPEASTTTKSEDATPENGSRTFPITGKVTEVDQEDGVVNIAHEEIPGLMPAMAMDFQPKDRSLLEDVRQGDEVEGTLEAEYQGGELVGLELTDLLVTYPAPPSPMILDFSGGEATLRAKRPELEPGQEVPDFTMTTQDGETLRLSDLRGQVVALTFVYTRCPVPDACPLMDKNFGELSNQLGRVAHRAEGVRLLSVSFDPDHDTPEILAEHARRRGAKPPLWTYTVASHEQLREVAEPLGLTYAPMTDEIRHSLSTAIIAPDGTLARLEKGPWKPQEFLQIIRDLLPASKPR